MLDASGWMPWARDVAIRKGVAGKEGRGELITLCSEGKMDCGYQIF
jgi:hypothetical protein